MGARAAPQPGIEAVVLGGSAGSFDTLRTILRALPGATAAPIVIVIHLPPDSSESLPAVLGADCALTVKFAEDKEPLRRGTVYIAPPGYHLLVESGGTFALSLDAPLHYSRPSIDVLFESASDAYRGRLVAILLSGASEDGAAGLQEIAAAGGVTIVQEPATAEVPIMPSSALALFAPTYAWPPERIASELPRLLGTAASTINPAAGVA